MIDKSLDKVPEARPYGHFPTELSARPNVLPFSKLRAAMSQSGEFFHSDVDDNQYVCDDIIHAPCRLVSCLSDLQFTLSALAQPLPEVGLSYC